MTRAQVEDLVQRRKASGSLLESLEVEGYARAADWVYQNAADHAGVPMAVLSEMHKYAVGLAWQVEPPTTRDVPGEWRKSGVRISRVEVALPAAIPADLDAWSASTKAPSEGVHPIVRAAIHHAWFERIHPFVDGNGRVGRLVLNFLLLQRGYPPAVIMSESRPRYLQALRTADQGNPNPLAELIARAVESTLNKFLIPKLAGEAKLVPLAALAASGPYSATYLRGLVLDGKLQAIREGKLWLSSRAWLSQYIAARDRRGRQTPPARRGKVSRAQLNLALPTRTAKTRSKKRRP